MSRLGVRIDRCNLGVPRLQHASRSESVQDGPLLRRESEDRDILVMKRGVAVQRVFTTDICNVFKAGDAGTRNDEGINWHALDGIPPSSTGVPGRLKGVGGTAMKGLANGKDNGVGLASVADVDDERAYATVFSFDDQASHDDGDPVHTEG